MDKMKLESVDSTAQNIEKIAELFPNCITETKDKNGNLKKAINFDLLKQDLSKDIVNGKECYEFTWVGKKESIIEANRPIRKTLRPCKEESVNWDTTENLYIEGDNLEVLKLLQESYLGKVKMIYIDPPYNTGNDFIYNDDFKISQDEYENESGIIDDLGNRFVKNTDANGRFHSDWCSMIYSRLLLARNLLSDTGAIFISIDDNEQENIKRICDEIFGGSNFISQVIVQTNPRGRTFDKYIAKTHEYILVYVKKSTSNSINQLPKAEDAISSYKKEDSHGRYRLLELRNRNPVFNRKNRPNLFYPFFASADNLSVSIEEDDYHKIAIYPRNSEGEDGCWTWGKEKAAKDINLLVANLANTGKWSVFRKDYLEGSSLFTKAKALWLESEMNNENGKEVIRNLFGKTPFDFPKSVQYIMKCLKLGSNKNDIVLDFFSGSATTAHAVMQLNAEDGGNRKFIMVQLPEPCDEKSEAFKAGYKNICEIGKERIRRAAKKIAEDNPNAKFDGGFRVFKVDDSNMKDVYYAPAEYSQSLLDKLESNIKEDRTDLDLFFGCILDWGLPLNLSYTSETIENCSVHTYSDNALIACFNDNIPESVIKEIAKRKPSKVVFRDSSFADTPSKINVTEIFKLLSPDTRVKVI